MLLLSLLLHSVSQLAQQVRHTVGQPAWLVQLASKSKSESSSSSSGSDSASSRGASSSHSAMVAATGARATEKESSELKASSRYPIENC